MSALDLDAIKARSEAATEGPWEAATCHESEQETRSEYVRSALLKPDNPARGLWVTWKPNSPLGVHLTAVTGDGPHGEDDAEFIAHAREDVPALVAEVECLRARLDAVMAIHSDRDGDCAECEMGTGQGVDWPCDTYTTALGVTR